MDKWMAETVKDLQLLQERKLAAEGLRIRIRRLEADMVSLTGAGGGGVPVKGGGNRQEQRLTTFIDRKRQLEQTEKGLQEQVEHTEKCLQSLPEQERLVLETMYCKGITKCEAVRRLEQELYISGATVYRIREQALLKLAIRLGYV